MFLIAALSFASLDNAAEVIDRKTCCGLDESGGRSHAQ